MPADSSGFGVSLLANSIRKAKNIGSHEQILRAQNQGQSVTGYLEEGHAQDFWFRYQSPPGRIVHSQQPLDFPASFFSTEFPKELLPIEKSALWTSF